MTAFSKQWTEEILLPSGEVAVSAQDVDAYLAKNKLAWSGDYSAEYLKNIRQNEESGRKKELFSEFIKNYKRSVWV